MDKTAAEEAAYANIRPFIRSVILPLVQLAYDENPSDEIQFCADYFNALLQKRENDSEYVDGQIPNCAGESNQKKEATTQYQYESVESKGTPTNAQGSASAPILPTGKLSETVNVRETSSWDTPSKVTEPIKSLAVLEDAMYGIGDQPSTKESQMTMQNDIKAGDAITSLKHDSFDENKIVSKVINDSVAEEYLKSTHVCKESAEEDLKVLCTQFERMEFPKSDLRHDDSDQEVAQTMDIKLCRKQLSPNSSFGFVPHLDECDSLKDMTKLDSESCHDENLSTLTGEISMIQSGISQILKIEPDSEMEMGKIDSEDSQGEILTSEIVMISRNKIADNYQNEHDTEKEMGKNDSEDSDVERSKTHNEELSKTRRKVSETLRGLSDKISSAKVQLNAKFEDAKERIGGIREQNNESVMDFAAKSDRISASENYFIEEKQNEIISNISDKYETDDIEDINNTCSGKVHPSESPFTQMCSFVRNMLDSDGKEDEDENTDVTDPMDFEKEYFQDKERSEIINDAEDDDDKSDEFEPQIVFEKLPRNMPAFIKSEKKEDEKAEINFSKPLNAQQETFADTEKPEIADFEIDAEDANGKFGDFEPQIIFEKMPKSEPVSIKSEKIESQEAEQIFTESPYSQQKMLPDEFKCRSSFVRSDSKDDNNKYDHSEPQIVVQKPWRRKLLESQPSVHKSKIFQSKEKGGEGAKTMDFQRETFLDKENPKITASRIEAEDDHDESDRSESQIVVHQSLRRRWNDVDKNMSGYYDLIETRCEDPNRIFVKSTDSHQEKIPDEEKRETTFFGKDAENDYDKPNKSDSQIAVDKSMRKRWHKARPSLDSLISTQRRDPRLNRALYPALRPNFEEVGDVPPDRFYVPNSYMNCHTRYQNTSESSRSIRECNFSGSSTNEIRKRSNSAAPSHNLLERQKPGEEKSNANSQSIPHSGGKLCKQSHSSENLGHFSKDLQAKPNEDVCDSANFIKQENFTSLNEVEITSEIEINGSEETFFEASDGITDEANLGNKDSEEKKLKQCEDVVKENVSVVLTKDQNVIIQDEQEAFTYSKDKSETNIGNRDTFIPDNSVTKEDKGKQSTTECIKMEKKCSDRNGVALDAQKEKVANNHSKIPMKCGLDAACGDCVSSVNDANEQDDDYEIIVTEPDENEENQAQPNNESGGGISMEYFQEVIEKVIEEQNYAYDDLNTSFYPESDSSYIEIEESTDFSDSDDSTIQAQ